MITLTEKMEKNAHKILKSGVEVRIKNALFESPCDSAEYTKMKKRVEDTISYLQLMLDRAEKSCETGTDVSPYYSRKQTDN